MKHPTGGRRVMMALMVVLALSSPPIAGAAPESQAHGGASTGNVNGSPGPAPPAVFSRDEKGHATVRAVRLTEPLRLDGALTEDVYRTVPAITNFIQQLPAEGAPVSEKTEAWVLFDNKAIYVSARCWDSAPPSQWVANEYRRDLTRQTDTFGVGFDTFLDRRNGFIFYVNPVGAVSDYLVAEESGNFDWNGIWDWRVGRFDGGWTVEMQVPFKTLRYGPGVQQVWGIQLRRVIRRKNEWAFLNRVPQSAAGPGGFTRIGFGGTLVGLEVPAGNTTFEVKPYMIGRMVTDRAAAVPVSNDGSGDVGVDVKYGVTANLTADFTYNTDFAQVEVDEQQVNLTRFSIQFPEKREFFLEGRGLFDFAPGAKGPDASVGTAVEPVLFYTRRIGLERSGAVPLELGGRLTGKAGRFGIGALNIQADKDRSGTVRPTNFAAVRLKRDVLRHSFVGAMFTNRSDSVVAGRGSNQAYGVDALFRFFANLYFTGNYARTRTPGLEGRDTSYQTTFAYNGDRYGAQLDHLFVGDAFNPEVGFLRRSDLRRTLALARFSPRPRSDVVRKFTWEGNLEYFLNGAGDPETRTQVVKFNTEFENSDIFQVEATNNYELLVKPFRIARGVTIPAGGYRFRDVTVSYQLGQQRAVNGKILAQRGSFYDGTITVVSLTGARISVTPQLSLEPTISINRVELPHGNFTSKLLRTRINYTFTPRMFVSGLLQYSSADRTFSSNIRFRWEYRPGSELFLVYTDERDTTVSGVGALRNRGYVVKINRLFRF